MQELFFGHHLISHPHVIILTSCGMYGFGFQRGHVLLQVGWRFDKQGLTDIRRNLGELVRGIRAESGIGLFDDLPVYQTQKPK